MRKPDFILFGQGNYNTLGVLHELSTIKVDPLLLVVGRAKDWRNGNIIGHSKFAKRVVEVESPEAGYQWIKEHFEDFSDGTVIYPTSDVTEKLLDQNYDTLSIKFRFPNVGRRGGVSTLMDKRLQTYLAGKSGLRVLESQFTTSLDFSFEHVKYPCMVKPVNSTTGSKGDMRVCDNQDELRKAISSGVHTHEFVVQQYINNESDLLFLGVSFSNGEVWIPAVVVKPGVSPIGEYTYAIISTDVESYLPEINEVRDFVRTINYVGPFSIEFGRQRGLNYFFEINLRNDGTSHYPLKAGVNIAQAYMEDRPVTVKNIEYEMIDEVGDLRRVFGHELSFFRWIKLLQRAGAYRFYHSGDSQLIVPLTKMFISRTTGKILRMFR